MFCFPIEIRGALEQSGAKFARTLTIFWVTLSCFPSEIRGVRTKSGKIEKESAKMSVADLTQHICKERSEEKRRRKRERKEVT